MNAKIKNKNQNSKQQLKIFEPDLMQRFKNIIIYNPANLPIISLYKQIKSNSFFECIYFEDAETFLAELERKTNTNNIFDHTSHFLGACNLGALGMPFINFYLDNSYLLNLDIIQKHIETKILVKNAK